MTARDLLLSKRLPGNTLDQGAAVQRALSELANREIEVPQLSGIATDFGLINAGTIVMGNGQPLGAGFTGVMRFADPLEWPSGSGSYWTEIGFQTDIMMYGISAADGSVYAAGGLLALYNKGLSLTGPVGLVNFQSLNAFQVYSGGLGFALVNGASTPTPYWSLTNDSSLTGSNLVTNGDFETGTSTGWTFTTTAPGTVNIIAGVSIFSKYALVLGKPTNAAVATATSDRVTGGVIGGKGYVVSFIAVKNATQGQVLVNWYDSAAGGTLLRTDTMPINLLVPGSGIGQRGWGQHVFHTLSPTGAASFEVVCQAPAGGSAPFGSVYVDNVTVHASSVLEMLVLRETGLCYSHNGVEVSAAPHTQPYKLVVAASTTPTDALTDTIPANSMGTNGCVIHRSKFVVYNTGAGTVSCNFEFKFGTTSVFNYGTLAAGPSTPRLVTFYFEVVIANTGNTSAQTVQLIQVNSPNLGLGNFASGGNGGATNRTTEDTTSDQPFTITCTLNTASNSAVALTSSEMLIL